MPTQDIVTFSLIHLLLPLLGLVAYVVLAMRMKKEEGAHAPIISMFILFFSFGGLLLIMLTDFFWKWSALASLGAGYVSFIAPIIMGVLAFRNRKSTSKYGRWIFIGSVSYFVTLVVGLFLILLLK